MVVYQLPGSRLGTSDRPAWLGLGFFPGGRRRVDGVATGV
ncbi:MAG: hypothetical protein AVDCRST_MAG41-182 [uncultured Corynebacteriales bacterium]|uniref:Uncharacterized protein n=1 Tax=uncultured Mycobacteriales bacterium TaxID=581187 RepID=A0A6J4H7I0_9ACTN|nr:MAG: hypothetical protein AVDCRST_MAG41-182 [uncultured Corynebacteriales bacterium]